MSEAATASDDATKTVTEEVLIGDKEFAVIAEKTKEAILPEVEEAIAKGTAVFEDMDSKVADIVTTKLDEAVGKIEASNKKKVADSVELEAWDLVGKGLKDGTIDKDIAEMTPAMRFAKGIQALSGDTPDLALLKKLNAFNAASQASARKKITKQEEISKAGYANEAVAAEGAVLIPDAEFVTTVFENLPKYGVVFREADVRQTDRTSVRVISLDSGLTFYATAEAGVKTSAKLAFSKNEVSLAKYAVIVPATDELTDDAAIDYWNVVTNELSRAYARVADEVAFLDATNGITNASGVLTENVSGAGTTVKWDDLLDAQAKTEDALDESNHKWYMRKETWYRLVQTKGTTNDHYLAGSLNSGFNPSITSPTTPWGTPVVFTRVLPSSNTVQTNDAFAVYGDLRNYIFYNKRGMALTMSNEATILDAGGASFNLFTQDATAMRAVIRILGVLPKGNRSKFVVLGTGTVS